MGKGVDKTTSPKIPVFCAFESSINAFDNIFGNNFFLRNTVLLKFQTFIPKPEVCKNGENFLLQKGLNYDLVVNVQKDACFGFSWRLCTIFKICGQFSEIANFEKNPRNSVSSKISFYWVFLSEVYLAVHMHAMNLLKI